MYILKSIIYGFFYPILACGVIMYIVQFFGDAKPPSFELAIISAVIGGFALSGGFLQQASSSLRRKIKCIGALYLGAAIAFTVFTLVLAMAKIETTGITYWIVLLANLISMCTATICFAIATGWIIAEFPTMFRELWSIR